LAVESNLDPNYVFLDCSDIPWMAGVFVLSAAMEVIHIFESIRDYTIPTNLLPPKKH
jgi:hypothetical protein